MVRWLSVFLLGLQVTSACGSAPLRPDAHAYHSPTPPTSSAPYEFRLRVEGAELFVRATGGGDRAVTLIALHGGPGYSHEYLLPLERLASPRLRVVTFDQRGAGRSSAAAGARLTLADHVRDVEAVRAALTREPVIILGHSWGGVLAEAYAGEHPGHVRSLVLVDPMPHSQQALGPVIARAHARRRELVSQGLVPLSPPPADGDDCRGAMNAELPVDFADPRHPSVRGLVGTSCSAHAAEVTFASLGSFDLSAALARIAAPILLVYGEADPNALDADAIAEHLTSAERVERALFPQCGHYPFLECPEPFFARASEFLGARR